MISFAKSRPSSAERVTTITLSHDIENLPQKFELVKTKIEYRINAMKHGLDCAMHKVKYPTYKTVCIFY